MASPVLLGERFRCSLPRSIAGCSQYRCSSNSNLLTWGGGLSASGVGTPVGAILLVTGATLFATGKIAYLFTNDFEIEQWIKQSTWGTECDWDFEGLTISRKRIDVLNSLIYSFKCEVWHDRLNNNGGVRVTSPFFRHNTKIMIEEMKVLGGDNEEEIICRDLVVVENYPGKQYSVDIITKDTIDIVCTIQHKSQLKERKKAYVRLYIDLFGNGNVILPMRGKPLEKTERIIY